MKYFALVILALLFASAALAECSEPEGFEAYSLENITVMGRDDGLIEIGLIQPSGSIVKTPVPKNSLFARELVSRDAFFENWLIRYWCDGNEWRQVGSTPLRIRRYEAPEPVKLPKWHEVKKGEDWKAISRETGVSADSLKKWNSISRGLYQGEHVFVEDPEQAIRRWEFLGGKPCTVPLPEQIQTANAPERVKEEWLSLYEATRPDTIWMHTSVDSPRVVNGLCFGDGTWWGLTACLWKDPKTLQPIDSTRVERYPYFDYDGYRWYLYRCLYCNNAMMDNVPLRFEGVTQVEEQLVTIQEPEPVPATPPEAAPEPEPVKQPWDLVENGTIWVTYEHVHPENADSQNNGFTGIEWVVRRSYDSQGVALVLRTHQDVLDEHYSNHFRAGLRFKLYSRTHSWFAFPEAGSWYGAQRMSLSTYQRISPDTVRIDTYRRFFDDYGWYARFIGVAPQLTILDAFYRQGKSLDQEIKVDLTTEPGFLYGKAAVGKAWNNSRSRHFDGMTMSFPADTMRTYDFRLGVKPWSNWVFYGSWNDWKFGSSIWAFRWWGPGGGLEWRISNHWRFVSDFKYFDHCLNYDRITGAVYDDPHWRLALTVNRNW